MLAVGVERDADDTKPVCAVNVWITLPVLLFQTLTVPSPPAEARRSPSGLNATLLTSVLSRRMTGSTRQSRMR